MPLRFPDLRLRAKTGLSQSFRLALTIRSRHGPLGLNIRTRHGADGTVICDSAINLGPELALVGPIDCNKKCTGSFSLPVEETLTPRVARMTTRGSTLLLFVRDLRPLRWMLVTGLSPSLTKSATSRVFSSCFYSFCTHSYIAAVPLFASAGDAPQFSGCSPCPAYELGSYRSSTRCCPPASSPITCDHDDFFELPDCSREAGSLFTLSGHASAGPLVVSGIPAQTLPFSCPAFPRRQNSW
jgi:hypothetical protein